MHELFELVQQDPEVWSPISKLGAVMEIRGTPQVGDFMAVHNGVSSFLCGEANRVEIESLEGNNMRLLMGRGVPNWLQQATSALRVTQRGIFYQGVQLAAGDAFVYDGCFITVEKASAAEAS